MRACIRVKMLLPGEVLSGWLLVAAAPFNGLLVLVTFVALAQVAPSPLLLAGMLLWLAAPLAYLARAGVYTRPIASADELRSARRVQVVAWVLALGAAGCLLAYAATWEAFGLRLVGLDAKTSLFRPWQVVRYGLDFSPAGPCSSPSWAPTCCSARRCPPGDTSARSGPGPPRRSSTG
jgi:hypothetical protein